MSGRRKVERTLVQLGRLTSYAAEIAYFLALSLVPFLVITLTLGVRWVPLDLTAEIEEILGRILPVQAQIDPARVFEWARSSAASGWLPASIAVASITVLRFMFAVVAALSFIATRDDRLGPQMWRRVAAAALLVAVWAVSLLATALLLFVAPIVEGRLADLPEFADPSVSAFAALRVVTMAAILFVAIFLTYRFGPGDRIPASRAALAALLTAAGWLGTAQLFTALVPTLWSGAQVYGTLGSIVLFLTWAYVYAWILLAAGMLVIRPAPHRERWKPVPGRSSAAPSLSPPARESKVQGSR